MKVVGVIEAHVGFLLGGRRRMFTLPPSSHGPHTPPHFRTCRNMLKMRYMTPESAGAHRTVREGGGGGGEVEGARSILFPSSKAPVKPVYFKLPA